MSRYDEPTAFKAVEGCLVRRVERAKDDLVLLHLDRGVLEVGLEGDCCSSSTFTDTKQFEELVGARIREVEERVGRSMLDGVSEADKKAAQVAQALVDEEHSSQELVSWHFLVFTTDKGHVTVDWRNDSNGYYDGWVTSAFREHA